MGKRPEPAFFQRRHANGQQARAAMLNITNHQGHANQNLNETSQDKRQQRLAGMQRKGSPCVLLVRIQLGAASIENGMEAPQKLDSGTTIGSRPHLSVCMGRNEIPTFQRHLCPREHCSVTHSGLGMDTAQVSGQT